MKIGIAADHAGYKLKRYIIDWFIKENIAYQDFGTDSHKVSVDYPDFIFKVTDAVRKSDVDKGIVICGSGIGASIVANKIKGIRAARCENEYVAKFSRLHNDANVLALGERVLGTDLALSIVKVWLSSKFEGGRHQRRIDKIKQIENNSFDI